jgi:mono/diheme cytochrome c family protein
VLGCPQPWNGFSKHMMRSRLQFVIFPLVLLFLSACSFSLAEDITPPPGSDLPAVMPTQAEISSPLYPMIAPNPAAGEPIYAEKCAPCHGSTGQGDGPQANQLPNSPSPLGDPLVARQARPADWYALVTQGDLERFMPPFNSLTDRQRWDVVAYALTLSTSAENLARGRELYPANCAECHGAAGQGDGPRSASLQTPATDFTDQQVMAGKSTEDLFQAISDGLPPAMPSYSEQLSEDDRWALADQLRMLSFTPTTENAAVSSPASSGAAVTQAPGTPDSTGIPGSAVPETGGATPPSETPSTNPGLITGQVLNASGSDLPADLTIALHGFDEMQQTYSATTTALVDGTFRFENVDMPPGRAFIASAEYKDIAYSSDVAVVDPGTTDLQLPFAIYETTTDPAVLSVDRLHFLFEYTEPETLRVVELYIISNLGDRTLVPENEGDPTVTFRLPEGATNLQFQDGALGERYVETENGFGDTAVIRPGFGNHQVVISFDLPYKNRATLVQPIDLATNATVVLIPEDGLKVKSDQLEDAGVRDVQGTAYHMYNANRLEPGTALSISISGRPGSTGLIVGSNSNLIIGAVAFGLVLIGAGVWLFTRSRSGKEEQIVEVPAGETIPTGTEDQDADTLLDAILALDDQFQAGELPEEAYRQRRAELKALLKEKLGS